VTRSGFSGFRQAIAVAFSTPAVKSIFGVMQSGADRAREPDCVSLVAAVVILVPRLQTALTRHFFIIYENHASRFYQQCAEGVRS
jgi:hypothetical protein